MRDDPGSSSDPLGGLLGKVAIVTGASRGIGRATAVELATRGADVVVVARRADSPPPSLTAGDDPSPPASRIGETGRRALAVSADLAIDDDLQRIVSVTLDAFGRIDFLVNNAAQFESVPVFDADV